MGVYIKGMDEIPEDGAVLVVMHDVNGKAYIKYACTYGYSMELVNVPEPHGRLIDENELTVSTDNIVSKAMIFGGQICYSQSDIDNASTVIEAGGE